MQELTMIVDLDERGWFKAHVENQNGRTVFELSNEDEETGWPSEDGLWLAEAGYMRHSRDADGLLEYLREIGIAGPGTYLSITG